MTDRGEWKDGEGQGMEVSVKIGRLTAIVKL